MRLSRRGTSAALVFAAAACTSSTATTNTVVTIPTSIAVDPVEFLGNVVCSPDPGAAKAFVVKFHDFGDSSMMSDPKASAAGTCTLPIAAQDVKETHQYSADVDVYDVPPEEVQVGITKPAWSTQCATDGNGLARVVNGTRAFIHGCKPLEATGTSTTSIVIDIASLVGVPGAGCVTGGGSLAALNVTPVSPSGSALPTIVVACGESTVTYDQGLTPQTGYTFLVKAFGPSGTDALLASKCTAITRNGVRVGASCSPLSDQGSLSIDENALLSAGMLTCGGSGANAAASYDVTFDGSSATPIVATGVPCTDGATVGPLSAGAHGGDIVIRDSNGKRIAHAICFATVAPGEVKPAPCTPD